MKLDDLIKKYALQNAVKFQGHANPRAIIGKIFGEDPLLKEKSKEISLAIKKIVKEINLLTLENQIKELKKIAPDLLEKKITKEKDIFEFLGYKDSEKINTAFPPGPEKYPHIGHAKAALVNYLLAKKYHGKFILRFEDTNPSTVKNEYYNVIQEDLKWLGIEWDKVVYASDHMQLFYDSALKLIKQGYAYIDQSPIEEIRKSRENGVPTKYRDSLVNENLELWHKMGKMSEGEAILRLKIDLKHKNSTLRDPAIFRINMESHPRTKKKFRVWPNYDFQNAIMDSFSDIDIRLRSKEFELRSELQNWIQEKLNIKKTKTYEFGRFNLEGVESSGRIIREKIDAGKISGWDDPRLSTLAALRRRGFLPKAICNFVLSTGLSKAEAKLTWDDLIVQNRRLLDGVTRYSAIFEPVECIVEGAPSLDVELHLNPNEKKGGRKFEINDKFILSKKDLLKDGEIRLMDAINIENKSGKLKFLSKSFKDFKGKKIINWLPSKENIDINILMPDNENQSGIAESHIKNVKMGDIVQFERTGFCRLDNKKDMEFRFTHK